MGEKAEATPGPWHAFIRRNTHTFAVFGPENDPKKPVVEWVGLDATVTEFGARTVEANAHMLAASRDMYEALREAHFALLNLHGDYAGSSVCRRNQEVIAKAEGKSND